MSRIAIADIKPTGVVELTATEAHEVDGGYGLTGALWNGGVAGVVTAISSYGDPYKTGAAVLTGALTGTVTPGISDLGGAAIATGLGLVGGAISNTASYLKNGFW